MNMKITVIISTLLVAQVSASFYDVFQGAVQSVQNSFGKLFSDVVTDVKDTVDCTILAVEHVLSLSEDATRRYYEKCGKNSTVADTQPKQESPQVFTISISNNEDYLKKELPEEIDARINETLSKFFNGYNPHDQLGDIEKTLAKETGRLADVNSVVKQELDRLAEEIHFDFSNIEKKDEKPTIDNILEELRLLEAIERNIRNASEAYKIHKLIDDVLNRLHAIETAEAAENFKVDGILADLEKNSNSSYKDLRQKLEDWKKEEARHLDLIQNKLEEHQKNPEHLEHMEKNNALGSQADNGSIADIKRKFATTQRSDDVQDDNSTRINTTTSDTLGKDMTQQALPESTVTDTKPFFSRSIVDEPQDDLATNDTQGMSEELVSPNTDPLMTSEKLNSGVIPVSLNNNMQITPTNSDSKLVSSHVDTQSVILETEQLSTSPNTVSQYASTRPMQINDVLEITTPVAIVTSSYVNEDNHANTEMVKTNKEVESLGRILNETSKSFTTVEAIHVDDELAFTPSTSAMAPESINTTSLPETASEPATSQPEMAPEPTTSSPEKAPEATTSPPETVPKPIKSQDTIPEPATTSPPERTTEPTTTSPPETTLKPTTTSPPETTTEPTTTSPPETTTEPTTTSPPETTSEPTTKSPLETSTEPSTTSPPQTTSEPTTTSPPETTTELTTTSPPETTSEPTTTSPSETTLEPTTTSPPETTLEPTTTSPPETTTEPTTTNPPETTTEPTTTSPPETTSELTTTSPPETTTEPTTTSSPETTSEPTTTSALETSTEPSTTSPPETTSEPTTTSPPETTTEPTTAGPPETTSGPTTTSPPETTTKPTTTSPPETTSELTTTSPPETITEPITTSPSETTSEPTTTSPPGTTSEPTTTSSPETTSEPTTTSPPETTSEPTTTTFPETTSEPTSTPSPETTSSKISTPSGSHSHRHPIPTPSLTAFLNFIDRKKTTAKSTTSTVATTTKKPTTSEVPEVKEVHAPPPHASTTDLHVPPIFLPHQSLPIPYGMNNPTVPVNRLPPYAMRNNPAIPMNIGAPSPPMFMPPPPYARNNRMAPPPMPFPYQRPPPYGSPTAPMNRGIPPPPRLFPPHRGYESPPPGNINRPPDNFNRPPSIDNPLGLTTNKPILTPKKNHFDDPDYNSFFHLPVRDSDAHNRAVRDAQKLIEDSQRAHRVINSILNKKNRGMNAFNLPRSLNMGK